MLLVPDALESFEAIRAVAGSLAGYMLPLDTIEALWVGLGSMSSLGNVLRRRRGRPRKFAAPSRAVTLTLPESVLEELSTLAPDPSLAIVQLVTRRAPVNGREPAEVVAFGRRAVITVEPTQGLNNHAGIELVPLPDGRALITFDQPTTIAELELAIYDALDDPALSPDDRRVFEGIGKILRQARRADDVELLRRSIIVLQSPSAAATRGKRKIGKSA